MIKIPFIGWDDILIDSKEVCVLWMCNYNFRVVSPFHLKALKGKVCAHWCSRSSVCLSKERKTDRYSEVLFLPSQRSHMVELLKAMYWLLLTLRIQNSTHKIRDALKDTHKVISPRTKVSAKYELIKITVIFFILKFIIYRVYRLYAINYLLYLSVNNLEHHLFMLSKSREN